MQMYGERSNRHFLREMWMPVRAKYTLMNSKMRQRECSEHRMIKSHPCLDCRFLLFNVANIRLKLPKWPITLNNTITKAIVRGTALTIFWRIQCGSERVEFMTYREGNVRQGLFSCYSHFSCVHCFLYAIFIPESALISVCESETGKPFD